LSIFLGQDQAQLNILKIMIVNAPIDKLYEMVKNSYEELFVQDGKELVFIDHSLDGMIMYHYKRIMYRYIERSFDAEFISFSFHGNYEHAKLHDLFVDTSPAYLDSIKVEAFIRSHIHSINDLGYPSDDEWVQTKFSLYPLNIHFCNMISEELQPVIGDIKEYKFTFLHLGEKIEVNDYSFLFTDNDWYAYDRAISLNVSNPEILELAEKVQALLVKLKSIIESYSSEDRKKHVFGFRM
jgi:hypothetical protein